MFFAVLVFAVLLTIFAALSKVVADRFGLPLFRFVCVSIYRRFKCPS